MTTSVFIEFKNETNLSFDTNSTKLEIRNAISLAHGTGSALLSFEDVDGDLVMFHAYDIDKVRIYDGPVGEVNRSKWVQDLNDMHAKFGFHDRIVTMTPEELQIFLKFRIDFLQEELTEMYDAYYAGDAEEIVDALIDLCVVAIGTLDAFDIDAEAAWDAVHEANMSKVAGVKPNRPNPLKLPDLNKPEGWTPPSHEDNHGLLSVAFEDSTPTREE